MYLDFDGNENEEYFEGLETTVLCHEIDHLDGILHMDIADKVVEATNEIAKKQYELLQDIKGIKKIEKNKTIENISFARKYFYCIVIQVEKNTNLNIIILLNVVMEN